MNKQERILHLKQQIADYDVKLRDCIQELYALLFEVGTRVRVKHDLHDSHGAVPNGMFGTVIGFKNGGLEVKADNDNVVIAFMGAFEPLGEDDARQG